MKASRNLQVHEVDFVFFVTEVQAVWRVFWINTKRVDGEQEDRKNTENCSPQCHPLGVTRSGSSAHYIRLACPCLRRSNCIQHRMALRRAHTGVRTACAARLPLVVFTAAAVDNKYVHECPPTVWKQQQRETKDSILRGRTERINFRGIGEKDTRAELADLPQALEVVLEATA